MKEFTKERKSFNVHVTQEDIDRALRNSSSRCAVARAIARTFDKATHIKSDMQTISFYIGHDKWSFITPGIAMQHIVDFDLGDKLQPFKFQLREPMIVSKDPEAKNKAREVLFGEGKKRKKYTMKPKGILTKSPLNVLKGRDRHYGARRLRMNQDRLPSV